MSENREAKARKSLEKARAGQAAVKRLSRPVRGWIGVAQLLTVASAALGVVPYIALVRLGDLLLSAYRRDSPVDADRARGVLMLLLAAYGARLGLYFVALLLTHVADLKMRDGLRRSIVERLSRAPLAWFSDKGSGAVRKAVQDDASMVHTVIAHGPVDKTNALVSPLALLVYVFTLDWRLGLLSVCTVPMYGLTYSLTLRGMAEKTAEMDEKLERVSSTMVEFIAGIAVVKAFGRVGHAHANYIEQAEKFGKFYRAWAMPLVTTAALSQMWISIPVLLFVNLGGGALLIDAGVVDVPSGYDTVIGGDTALSGGQEQRIAIARAVLLDTPVLILDEATAMADPESEAEIQQALTALAKGKTVLVIAHRPGSIRGADQIVVLEGGRVRAAEGKEGK